MKYSLRFLYKLMLKDAGLVIRSKIVGTNAYSFDIANTKRDEAWEIIVERGEEDKLRNVVYLMSTKTIRDFPIDLSQFFIDPIIKR